MHLVQHIHGKSNLYFINIKYFVNWVYGKPLKCYKNGRLALVLESNNVFMTSKDVNDFIEFYNVNMRNVEIIKVFEVDIKRPCYIDSYSYRGNI